MINKFICIFLLLTFYNCNIEPEKIIKTPEPVSEKKITLTTDSLTYHFKGNTLVIPTTINNNSNTTIYYVKCGRTPLFATSKSEDGNWLTSGFWGHPCLAVYLMETIDVKPHSFTIDSLYVTTLGIYKFLLLYGWETTNLVSDTLFSNQFEVVE